MNIVTFILNNIAPGTYSEVIRCLDKSTIIIYDGSNVLVANKETIFYFGTIVNRTKEFHKFYHSVKHLMKDKTLFCTDEKLKQYNKRCEIIGKQNNLNKCIWRG